MRKDWYNAGSFQETILTLKDNVTVNVANSEISGIPETSIFENCEDPENSSLNKFFVKTNQPKNLE